ncbi:MAG: VpaChn25_0724 family phage protein [Halothiobacillus sp.]
MKKYAEIIAEDRRLVLLQALNESPDYALRETVLVRLLAGERLAIGTDDLRIELRWLADRGLVDVEYHDEVQAARITVRGIDVANGHMQVEGIARPRP